MKGYLLTILRLIDDGENTVELLCDATGVTPQSVRQYIKALTAEKLIINTASPGHDGRYVLTHESRKHVTVVAHKKKSVGHDWTHARWVFAGAAA